MTVDTVLSNSIAPIRSRESTSSRRAQKQVQEALLAVALAHTVTPVEDGGEPTLQAASPDEVALVKFAESVGLILRERSINRVVLRVPGDFELSYDILAEFPFTSEATRMGVIVQNQQSKNITLYVKGADTVMSRKVRYNDWLDEESVATW
ncbi:putative phospholipid-transporting ATPase IIB [Gracilariopsis chorda]|uniref:Putative phospholipid-transporting ATPase IIB n=1 Tax=Gracilariopsis chorda TaxID=448386 RepID=A0A2V3ILZ5_9FLOR|nr:putative phospholipid-transporting ATPase IIB [Gracilariopsis chorda]|eukprot:PXF43079.1 putative phospholipid-transporting ATPase IIB [Gracilariopsis chorda]